MEALHLIEINQKLSPVLAEEAKDWEDKRIKARILASRPERRKEALKLLEEVAAKEALSPDDEFLQAQLYDDSQWPKAHMKLQYLLGATPPPAHGPYLVQIIQGLIKQREFSEAPHWLNQLEKLYPNAIETLALRAQLLKEQSGVAQAEEFLTQRSKDKDAPLVLIAGKTERKRRSIYA